jgi:hypothetical protein
MSDQSKRRHVFISHHHQDDAHVDQLSGLLGGKGWDIRNSSIRAKPANQARLDKGQIPERTLKRLLRMKISWATVLVVLIGDQTHSRPWVNWEIEQANKLGKRIVGVFAQGGKNSDIPQALERYGTTIVGWNSDSIISAIDGEASNRFENPDGSKRSPVNFGKHTTC